MICDAEGKKIEIEFQKKKSNLLRTFEVRHQQKNLGALKGGWGKKSLSVCVCESVESLTRTDLAHRSLASGPSGPRLARSALDLFYIRFYNLATQAIGAVTKSELIKLRFLKGFLIRAARPYNYSVATKSLPYGTTHDWRSKTPIQYMT